jgi:hypothetical protein
MQNVVQTALEKFDDMLVIDANENVSPLFARADETLVAQSAQLVRNGGFGQTDTLHQFTYADFTFHESGNNANPGGIAQGFEEIGEIERNFGCDVGLGHHLDPAADALLVCAVHVAIFFEQEKLLKPHRI